MKYIWDVFGLLSRPLIDATLVLRAVHLCSQKLQKLQPLGHPTTPGFEETFDEIPTFWGFPVIKKKLKVASAPWLSQR